MQKKVNMIHKLKKGQLKTNNIISIYLNWKEKKDFRGNAILIERLKDPSELQKEYLFCEIGKDSPYRKKDLISIIYSYQRWIIKFVDGPEKGFQTAVNISYYKKTLHGREQEQGE